MVVCIFAAERFDSAYVGSNFDESRQAKQGRVLVAEYPYCDETGEVLYIKVRFWPKDFRQYVPLPGGGKQWNLNRVAGCDDSGSDERVGAGEMPCRRAGGRHRRGSGLVGAFLLQDVDIGIGRS